MVRSFGVLAAVAVPILTLGDAVYNESYLVEVFGNNPDFLWGAATAAAQIEGAWNVSDKQPSIWDDFCHSIRHRDTTDDPFSKTCGNAPAGKEDEWTTLAVTDDFYHLYNEDLDMLSGYNMNAMRISLSWPRLMPLNKATGKHEPSADGIQFYKDVLTKMRNNGITPVVTLFHWDLPNDLSWLEEEVVNEFAAYATMAFENFGEYIQDWATFNEPSSVCSLGYARAAFAPGHKSTTGHLVCGHNVLKAHAKAVKIFREKGDLGQIGIVIDYKWTYPETDSEDDKRAAEFDRDNMIGFWADPIFLTGDYPQSMKDFFGPHMPVFTLEEQMSLKGSADFYGANTYGGKLGRWTDKTLEDYTAGEDMAERYSFSPCDDGEDQSVLVDPSFECGAASGWLWAKPDSMFQYLNYINERYAVPIYVTEFGADVDGESDMTKEVALKDTFRQDYYQRYMMQIAKAKDEAKAPIKGVFAWSLMDNFEWGDGLNFRFGITYVDFDDLKRYPKDSAMWWKALIAAMNPESQGSYVTV